MSTIDIIDQHITIEVKTHDPDPRQRPPWGYDDLTSGRVNWGVFRNSRWFNVLDQNATD